MLNLLIIVLMSIACIVLIGIIVALGLYLRGIDSIAFPGLGLIVGTGLILFALLVLETCAVFSAAYLMRYVSFERLLSWL